MSETIDPISLLKDYIVNKKEMVENSHGELVFEGAGIKLPLET